MRPPISDYHMSHLNRDLEYLHEIPKRGFTLNDWQHERAMEIQLIHYALQRNPPLEEMAKTLTVIPLPPQQHQLF